jgi:hypothetical protein
VGSPWSGPVRSCRTRPRRSRRRRRNSRRTNSGQRHQWQCDVVRRGRSSRIAASLALAGEPGASRSSGDGSGEP